MTKAIIAGVIAILLLVAGVAMFSGDRSLSGATEFVKKSFTEGFYAGSSRQTELSRTGALRVGTSGTSVSRVNAGECYLAPGSATIAATSTALIDCQATAAWDADGTSALTGVTYGDSVQVTFATSTTGNTNGIVVQSASASSTAGYIQLRISNLTGTTFTWPTSGTASGTASYISID